MDGLNDLPAEWRERAQRWRAFAQTFGLEQDGVWWATGPLSDLIPERIEDAAEALYYALLAEAASLEFHAAELAGAVKVEE